MEINKNEKIMKEEKKWRTESVYNRCRYRKFKYPYKFPFKDQLNKANLNSTNEISDRNFILPQATFYKCSPGKLNP